MKKEELYRLLENGPIYLDGATGSNLQKAGMPTGVCPEQWILDHPDVILDLQKRYIEAGTQILYAPTFSGNRIKLEEYGLADKIVEINTKLVQLCREAAGEKGLVCGDMTMTGESLEPMGDLELEELIDIYKEQAKILYEAGVDLFVVETMMSLAETRAAVLAIKETCDLPIMVSMTFDEKGKTLYGNTPEGCMVVLQSLGADVVGINCSTGPERMADMVRQMKPYANVPILAKPNAVLCEKGCAGGSVQQLLLRKGHAVLHNLVPDADQRRKVCLRICTNLNFHGKHAFCWFNRLFDGVVIPPEARTVKRCAQSDRKAFQVWI